MEMKKRATAGSSGRLRTRGKQLALSYAMLTPFLIFFLLVYIMPILVSIVLGFTNFNMMQTPEFTGFTNYIRLFLDDDVFITAFSNTLVFAFISGPISYVLCFMLAWLINDLNPRLRSLMTVCFYAPSVAGQGVYVVWRLIFSADSYGIINGILMWLGLVDEPVLWLSDPSLSLGIVILVHVWLSLGTGFLAFIAGLQNIDRSQYEAAAIDGIRNRWMELWYITLPNMLPMLIFGAVTQIARSFAVADVSMELAGFPSIEYSAHTIDIHAYDYGFVRFEMGYACAITVVLFIIIVTVNQIVTRALRRVGS